MNFDFPTLVVAAALNTAFCSAARILLWRRHPSVPGLGHWAWAGVLAAIALVLLSIPNALPHLLSLSLAQLLMAAGMVVTWDGYRSFIGRATLTRPALLAVALGALATIALPQLSQDLSMRTLSTASLISVISALIAATLLRTPSAAHIARRITGWIYAANSLFFIVRAIVAISESRVPVLMGSSGLATITLLWWQCMSVALTLGMVLMTGERLQIDLDRQASLDPLTGILNRRAFSQLAEREVARARRHGQPLSVLMMDLDHFKQINDRLGHSGGDAVLCLFVDVVARVLRREDIFCRFGGEEFIALLPDSAGELAMAAAERLRLAYGQDGAALPWTATAPPPCTVSIGIAQLRDGEALENTMRRADAALYRAKAKGRNRCELAEPENVS